MSGALSDERSGLSFTMYNVQYIYILHVILSYSFTNLVSPNLPPCPTHTQWRIIFWNVEALLGNDRERNSYTTADTE
jgi:hypothetical protein